MLIAFALLTLVVVCLAGVIYGSATKGIEARANFAQLQDEIKDLQQSMRALDAEFNQAQAERADADSRRNVLDQEARRLKKQVDDLRNRPPELVHEVGDPMSRSGDCWTATVVHRGGGADLIGIDGQPLNPIWNTAQKVEVWASSMDRAREMIEAKYPENAGFRVLQVQPAPAERKAAQ